MLLFLKNFLSDTTFVPFFPPAAPRVHQDGDVSEQATMPGAESSTQALAGKTEVTLANRLRKSMLAVPADSQDSATDSGSSLLARATDSKALLLARATPLWSMLFDASMQLKTEEVQEHVREALNRRYVNLDGQPVTPERFNAYDHNDKLLAAMRLVSKELEDGVPHEGSVAAALFPNGRLESHQRRAVVEWIAGIFSIRVEWAKLAGDGVTQPEQLDQFIGMVRDAARGGRLDLLKRKLATRAAYELFVALTDDLTKFRAISSDVAERLFHVSEALVWLADEIESAEDGLPYADSAYYAERFNELLPRCNRYSVHHASLPENVAANVEVEWSR
jgi:hypothetical protein